MSWVCEVIVTGHETERPSLDAWLSRTASPCWRSFPGLSSLDVYEPAQEKGRDPYNHQEASPLLIAILEFESESALKTAVDGSAFPEALRALPPGLEAKASVFERAFYAVEDGETASNTTAMNAETAKLRHIERSTGVKCIRLRNRK